MVKNIILLLCALLYLSFGAFSHSKTYEKKYSNHQYGYSVMIPKGTTVRTDSASLPQHGFRISLSVEGEAYIWVDGSYNTLDWANLEEAVNTHLDWLKQESTDFVQTRQESAFLDKLQALRSIVRYRDATTTKLMIQDLLLALRQRKNQTGILYNCGLRTSEPRYPEDKLVFENMIRSWELRPLSR